MNWLALRAKADKGLWNEQKKSFRQFGKSLFSLGTNPNWANGQKLGSAIIRLTLVTTATSVYFTVRLAIWAGLKVKQRFFP